jgi:hypothetical protein
MVLDPMSALAIAAATIQFVDFACTVVCKSKALHLSADGTLQENKQTETVTMRLKELAEGVAAFAAPADLVSNLNNNLPNPRLKNICTDCGSLSDELIERLHHLKIQEQPTYRR